jgi:hypothetical protein
MSTSDHSNLVLIRSIQRAYANDARQALADVEAERDAVLGQLRSDGADDDRLAEAARKYGLAIAELEANRDHSDRHADWASRKLQGA